MRETMTAYFDVFKVDDALTDAGDFEEAQVVTEQERSTLVFVLFFCLALLGIYLINITVSYLYCLYRFFTVWNHIFRVNRIHQEWLQHYEESPTLYEPGTIQKALVTRAYCGNMKEEETTCPVCLVDFCKYHKTG